MADRVAGKKIKRVTAITRVIRSASASLELEVLSRVYVREMLDIMDCDGCAIMIIEGDKVRILADRDFSETWEGTELNTDLPAIKQVMSTKQAILATDVTSSPASSYIPSGSSINSLIYTPVIVGNDVMGIIHLYSLKQNAFSEEDIELVDLLAREISIALSRSFQYSQGRDMSIRDQKTGSLTLRKFDSDIVAEVARAKEEEQQLSLMMIDIDWFKKYNDFHGYQKGDSLLKKLADMLTYGIRPYDKIYRYGGGKFAILMPTTNREQALTSARRLQSKIQQAEFEGAKESQPEGKITVSIGMATLPSDADQSDKLVEAANSALYRAKKSGRNQVCVSD